VRRSSGEKSCILEEMRKATNRRDDEVAIGLTFNNNMSYKKIDDEYIQEVISRMKIILSIICRISCLI
jgi:hypothetical protein